MDLRLRASVAFVTGASRGIGRAVAEALGAEGVSLAIVARTVADLEAVRDKITITSGTEVLSLSADLRDPEEVERVVAAAWQHFGRIDILANVAGTTMEGRLHELSDAQWEEALGLKFMGTVRTCRAVLPIMRSQRSGCIINTAGTAGWQPQPWQLAVGAVNAAVLNFTRALSREAPAEGVRVNAVVPGRTATGRFQRRLERLASERGVSLDEAHRLVAAEIPNGRVGTPEEVAATYLFLASGMATHVNGVAIEVDGGTTRGLH